MPDPGLHRRPVLAGLAGAALGAVLPRPARSAKPITLRITHGFVGIHLPMVAALVQRFMELHPDIAVEATPGGDNWDPHLQATLRAGIVNDLPDLSHQTLAYTRVLLRRGYVQPLDRFLAEAGGGDALGLPRPMLESARLDGRLYAIPVSTTLPVIYYNRDLLRRGGWSEAGLPQDWTVLLGAARAVAGLGNRIIGGYVEYTSTNAWMFQNLLAAFGGRMVDAAGTDVAFDSPAGLEAMRVLAGFGAATTDMTQNQARQAFDGGTLGLNVRSASGIPAVQAAARNRFALDIGLFPVPSPQGQVVGAGNGVVVFTKDPDRQRAAWDWIRFVIGPEAQAIIATRTGYMPVSLAAAQDDRYMGQYYRDNPLQRVLVSKLAITADWYSFPDNPVRIFDAMAEELRRTILGQDPPEQALAAMAEETRRLMRQA
jgi:multiple sugar transport system substrate-binding protein